MIDLTRHAGLPRQAILIGLAMCLAWSDALRAQAILPENRDTSPGSTIAARNVREVGVPVRSVNWVRLHPGRDRVGHPRLYATMGQEAENFFLLQIDPSTGASRQFVAEVPEANSPTATLMSRTGRLYVGAAYAGHLFSFDPAENVLADRGPIHSGQATFPCQMDEGPDGRIWIGSYPTADLTSFDPRTGEFAHYGRMDEVDMYNYPLASADGTIACLIRMTEPHVVVFDPRTGKKHSVGPSITKGEGSLNLHRGADGHLYLVSSEGNFRIEGTRAVSVESVPAAAAAPTLPDATTFRFADADQLLYRKLQVQRGDGTTQTFDLDYKASGSGIFSLHTGPDGRLYGSSILPLHLFRYDPQSDELIDLGRCSTSTGEAYSMANHNGKMYIASYPGARISVYDPGRAYHFGTGPESNPRDLGRIDEISNRPRSTLAGPLGRVWTASLPDYGMWGGPLSYFDPQTGRKKAYYRVAGDASCYSLAHLATQEWIAVGTSIAGGTGTQPKAKHAVLFLWDYKAEKKVWQGSLDEGVTAINALLLGSDGKLYGTAHGSDDEAVFFVFDPAARRFTHRVPLPGGRPLDLGLRQGREGTIYGFTDSCLYSVDPATLSTRVLLRDSFRRAGPLLGDEIYFATGQRLRAAKIF